ASDSLRAASPTVTHFLATVVTDPSFESTAASALVTELVDFAAHGRLDYAASLVAESASVCPPSVGGECALSTDVLEDRQEEFQCFAAALPHLCLLSCVKGPEEESVGEEERRRFHSLVGSLMYAAVNTRPDVAFATGQLARVVQCPNEEQVAAGMRVAKYLGQTPTVGLQYFGGGAKAPKGRG
ncbi:unnamed protein product, partial [Closterium sp. NIES-54]